MELEEKGVKEEGGEVNWCWLWFVCVLGGGGGVCL